MSEELHSRPMEPGVVAVVVEESGLQTGHRVHLPEGWLGDLGIEDVDQRVVAEEVIRFLLDRETGAAIPEEVSVHEIEREFPDFTDELLARLS